MLSFEKCKQLYDAGLRREVIKIGDLYYFDGNVVCVITSSRLSVELIRCDSFCDRFGLYVHEFVRDSNFLPIFTLEEILTAHRNGIGLAVPSVESAADDYLEMMSTKVPAPIEISLGGIYRARGGGVAMVYAIFKEGNHPVRAVSLNSGFSTFTFDRNGFYRQSADESVLDLVEILLHITNYEFRIGDPMWRRRSDGSWVRSIVNETYLELIQEDPYSYAPVYEDGGFVRADFMEEHLPQKGFPKTSNK